MDDSQTPPADNSAPAPADDSSMNGDQVVDQAKTVLDNEPAMGGMGSSPAPSMPSSDDHSSDMPAPAPDAPAPDAAPEEETSPSDTPAPTVG